MSYTLNYQNLETQLRAINDRSADIFQWCVDEFEAQQAWVEIDEAMFNELAENPTLWTKEGEKQFGPYQNRFKWTADKRWYIQTYRTDYAPIKGWMRRAMQKVHNLRRYSQKDIERIAKAIRNSVEQN